MADEFAANVYVSGDAEDSTLLTSAAFVNSGKTGLLDDLPLSRVAKLREEIASISCSSDQDSDADIGLDEGKNTPYEPPSDELKEKIRKQVEFYFSDANIVKDAFLLKHVKRHKEGFVSLKLISSFRKVKSVTKDYRHVVAALRDSSELEINAEGTKVRRHLPLPAHDEAFASRTVIAFHLPMENPTVEQISQLFSPCGEIALVRILRPGKNLPSDVRKFLSKHPELSNNTCAVVEFERQEGALNACRSLDDSSNWRSGMRVSLMARGAAASKKEQTTGETGDKASNQNGTAHLLQDGLDMSLSNANARVQDVGGSGDGSKLAGNNVVRPPGQNVRNRKPRGANNKQKAAGSKDSSPAGRFEVDNNWRQKRSSLSPSGHNTASSTPQSSPYSSPRSSPMVSPNVTRRRISHGTSPLATADGFSAKNSPETSQRRISVGVSGGEGAASSPSGSPWIQRRLRAQADSVSPLVGLSPGTSPLLGRKVDSDRFVRQPKGPDGTKGFQPGAGRGKCRSDIILPDIIEPGAES